MAFAGQTRLATLQLSLPTVSVSVYMHKCSCCSWCCTHCYWKRITIDYLIEALSTYLRPLEWLLAILLLQLIHFNLSRCILIGKLIHAIIASDLPPFFSLFLSLFCTLECTQIEQLATIDCLSCSVKKSSMRLYSLKIQYHLMCSSDWVTLGHVSSWLEQVESLLSPILTTQRGLQSYFDQQKQQQKFGYQ